MRRKNLDVRGRRMRGQTAHQKKTSTSGVYPMEGYLQSESHNGFQAWSKGYFIFDTASQHIRGFDNKQDNYEDANAREEYDLAHVIGCDILHDDKRKFEVEMIETIEGEEDNIKQKILTFFAANENDALRWVAQIQKHLKSKRPSGVLPAPSPRSLSTVTPALPKIGRAVQQECRDRSRMPSSA
eukprot:TRINITY_DN56528_c0_g1_i8.p1 TRINITY_DN56528_c0_g1~~TRINITY_DN56528_c0_g1_i8.p1  ORF type:complete len:184 (-),score=30.46 TRINITY_DN56528_c0_g1_i8:11-562(-)